MGDNSTSAAVQCLLLRILQLFLRPDAGFHLQRLVGRSGLGRCRHEPRSQVGGPRHQPVPGGEGHEGLQQRTEAGEDGSEGPGTGAFWAPPYVSPAPLGADHRVYVYSLKDTAELFFEDVRLPANALLGEPNKGFYYLMNELPQVNRREAKASGRAAC